MLNWIKNFFLCLRYPFLKERNRDGKFMGYKFTWYDDIPYGWRKAFGKNLLKDLKSAIKQDKIKNFRFEQIKEKWGVLTIYCTDSDNIDYVISKYEHLSMIYCINCGKPVRYITGPWVSYVCEDCFDEYLDMIKESERLGEIERRRLTAEYIPECKIYDGNGNYKVEDYGVDFIKGWGLDDGKSTKK